MVRSACRTSCAQEEMEALYEAPVRIRTGHRLSVRCIVLVGPRFRCSQVIRTNCTKAPILEEPTWWAARTLRIPIRPIVAIIMRTVATMASEGSMSTPRSRSLGPHGTGKRQNISSSAQCIPAIPPLPLQRPRRQRRVNLHRRVQHQKRPHRPQARPKHLSRPRHQHPDSRPAPKQASELASASEPSSLRP